MLQHAALRPDLARATRAAAAFSGALWICSLAGVPLASQFAATAALGLSMPQLRGAYPHRVMLLGVMISVISGAALLGGLVAGHLPLAVAGIALLALLSGLWRHASADYGPALGIDSALLFLLALEGPSHGASPGQMALWTALGGTGAALLQVGLWAFRPQHPLRHAVAEAWVAASDLYLSMAPAAHASPSWTPQQRMLREALDRASTALHGVRTEGRSSLISHLEEMVHQAAHLAMQTTAWRTVEETTTPGDGPRPAAMEALLRELANLARSVAITLVMHRERNLGATRVRVRACHQLVQVLLQEEEGAAAVPHASRDLLLALDGQLASLEEAASATVEHSFDAHAVPSRLPDLSRAGMPAIAAWLNPVPFPDPSLVRYALRMAVLTMAAVAVYLHFAIPRGYWMAFAVIVVLQPDYGATRQRAFQRVTGTVAGALLASATLLSPLPGWLLAGLTAATAFAFAYFLKRRYGLAVFFVTIMIVLLTELHVPVHLDFTMGRLLSNLAGAGLALLAAAFFWPVSERRRFPSQMAGVLRAGADYFAAVAAGHVSGGGFTRDLVRSKQLAERAAARAAASLQRLLAEPGLAPGEGEHAADLVTSNDRLLRGISVLALRLETARPSAPGLDRTLVASLATALEKAATAVEEGTPLRPEELPLPEGGSHTDHALLLVRAEARALLLVAGQGVEARPAA